MRFTLITAIFVTLALTATLAEDTFSVSQALEDIISLVAGRRGAQTPGRNAPGGRSGRTVNAPHMYQLDPRWKNEFLGNSRTTIGRAGCAMSSVSAMLAAKGIRINGQPANPHTLNQYLKTHGGYAGDNIVWGAVRGLGPKYQGQITNKNQMVNDFKSGKSLILNVQGGGHWVLATGVTDKGFTVMNPGRSNPKDRNFYSFGEVVRAAIYAP